MNHIKYNKAFFVVFFKELKFLNKYRRENYIPASNSVQLVENFVISTQR